jgi:hypothetical protein
VVPLLHNGISKYFKIYLQNVYIYLQNIFTYNLYSERIICLANPTRKEKTSFNSCFFVAIADVFPAIFDNQKYF